MIFNKNICGYEYSKNPSHWYLIFSLFIAKLKRIYIIKFVFYTETLRYVILLFLVTIRLFQSYFVYNVENEFYKHHNKGKLRS